MKNDNQNGVGFFNDIEEFVYTPDLLTMLVKKLNKVHYDFIKKMLSNCNKEIDTIETTQIIDKQQIIIRTKNNESNQ